jgi:hypothetical protein
MTLSANLKLYRDNMAEKEDLGFQIMEFNSYENKRLEGFTM